MDWMAFLSNSRECVEHFDLSAAAGSQGQSQFPCKGTDPPEFSQRVRTFLTLRTATVTASLVEIVGHGVSFPNSPYQCSDIH